MNRNEIEKYFKQKKLSVMEIIGIIVSIISLVLATFVQGGGPIGLFLFALSTIYVVFSYSNKIKDEDFDKYVYDLIKTNNISFKNENTIKTFDYKTETEHYIKRGKDGKLRSRYYVVSEYLFNDNMVNITVYKLDVLTGEVEKILHKNDSSEIYVVKENRNILGRMQNIIFLKSDLWADIITVCDNDMYSDKILANFCCYSK